MKMEAARFVKRSIDKSYKFFKFVSSDYVSGSVIFFEDGRRRKHYSKKGQGK